MSGKASGPWSTRRLTRLAHSALYAAMEEQPRVVEVTVADEGAMIAFEDGKSGLFPAALLYAFLPQAEKLQAAEVQKNPGTQTDRSG